MSEHLRWGIRRLMATPQFDDTQRIAWRVEAYRAGICMALIQERLDGEVWLHDIVSRSVGAPIMWYQDPRVHERDGITAEVTQGVYPRMPIAIRTAKMESSSEPLAVKWTYVHENGHVVLDHLADGQLLYDGRRMTGTKEYQANLLALAFLVVSMDKDAPADSNHIDLLYNHAVATVREGHGTIFMWDRPRFMDEICRIREEVGIIRNYLDS